MKLLRNARILILIVALVLAVAAINPRPWQHGAAIRAVEKDSAAAEAGIQQPTPKGSPVLRERIISVNGEPVLDADDFILLTRGIPSNTTVRIETNKRSYSVLTKPLLNITILPELETITHTEEFLNETSGELENRTTTETRNKTRSTVIGTEPIGVTVFDAPTSNIRLGLDLTGGARVLLEPEEPVPQDQLDTIIDTITERLNVFGLSDIVVRPVSDLAGNQFILVEVAGASEKDVRELTQQQGKFEAKIGETSIFTGGDDITYVCRSPQCSGIARSGCQQGQEGFVCGFEFQITLSPAAAQRQADETRNLSLTTGPSGQQYLEKPLDLYLDDQLVDTLQIGASLKGNAVTQIAISGSGTGATERAAAEDALASMKKLQTILVTGSLPVKLAVVKTDTISSELGDEFVHNALFVGLLAFIAVTAVIMIRFRSFKISIPVMVTLVSELTIILGLAAVIGWNLDLAAIAGILIAIGTGVDDQIVIADETIGAKHRNTDSKLGWKEKLKKAFFIIMASYFTGLAAMIPLWWAGAGLVRGFAITTILGISIGVFITRPAFAAIIERLEEKE